MGVAAGIGLGLAGAQMGLDAYGQSKAAASQKRQLLVAQMFARQSAADAISLGGNLSARSLGEGSREAGSQRASTAGRGFEVGAGTAQTITDATDLISSIDAITIRENARREAVGELTAAYNSGVAAKGVSASAGIAGTLLGGASMVASQWEQRRLRNRTAAANSGSA